MPGDILKKRKIAVLGSRSVGKSSLVIQFTENQFIDSYYPTIENTFTKSVNYKGVDFDCDIIDTAGQDEYSILNSKHAIGIHGFVLVYSVTSRNSFDMIQIVYDKIVSFCGIKEIPCVIVGSKIDLSQRCNRLKARTLPRQIVRPGLRRVRRITSMLPKSSNCVSQRSSDKPRRGPNRRLAVA